MRDNTLCLALCTPDSMLAPDCGRSLANKPGSLLPGFPPFASADFTTKSDLCPGSSMYICIQTGPENES